MYMYAVKKAAMAIVQATRTIHIFKESVWMVGFEDAFLTDEENSVTPYGT